MESTSTQQIKLPAKHQQIQPQQVQVNQRSTTDQSLNSGTDELEEGYIQNSSIEQEFYSAENYNLSHNYQFDNGSAPEKQSKRARKQTEDNKQKFKNIERMAPMKLIIRILKHLKEDQMNYKFFKASKLVGNLDDIRGLFMNYEENIDEKYFFSIMNSQIDAELKKSERKKEIREQSLIFFEYAIKQIKTYILIESGNYNYKKKYSQQNFQCESICFITDVLNMHKEFIKLTPEQKQQKVQQNIHKIKLFLNIYNKYIQVINSFTKQFRIFVNVQLMGCQDHNFFHTVKFWKKWEKKQLYCEFGLILRDKLMNPSSFFSIS